MKKLKIWSMMVLVVMALPMMVACGGDDDDVNGNPVSDKHITMIEYQKGDEHIILNINYDTKGRIISADKNTMTPNHYSIEYTDNMIRYSLFQYIEYSLLDNRVVSAKSSYNINYGYSYKNNNIISCTESYHKYTYTWSNGNITKISYDNDEVVSIEYTNYKWPTNYVFLNFYEFKFGSVTSDVFGIPWILMPAGYCGNRPKNLPSEIGSYEYTYTMEDGYPIKVKIKSNDDSNTEILYNLSWN